MKHETQHIENTFMGLMDNGLLNEIVKFRTTYSCYCLSIKGICHCGFRKIKIKAAVHFIKFIIALSISYATPNLSCFLRITVTKIILVIHIVIRNEIVIPL